MHEILFVVFLEFTQFLNPECHEKPFKTFIPTLPIGGDPGELNLRS